MILEKVSIVTIIKEKKTKENRVVLVLYFSIFISSILYFSHDKMENVFAQKINHRPRQALPLLMADKIEPYESHVIVIAEIRSVCAVNELWNIWLLTISILEEEGNLIQ